MWFPNKSDTNQAVQAKKIAGDWKFWTLNVEGLFYLHVAETKVLICAFVFAYANCWFSHDATHIFHMLILIILTSCYPNYLL